VDLLDYKPGLQSRFKEDLKDWLAQQGQRLTGMTANQQTFPLAPSIFKFAQHGQTGAWISELLPWHAKMADDLCVIRSMHTDAINHEPANQLSYTGSMITGKASMGSWVAYGLGAMNKDLPTFVVLHASHFQPVCQRPGHFQRGCGGQDFFLASTPGSPCAPRATPSCFLKDAPGISRNCASK